MKNLLTLTLLTLTLSACGSSNNTNQQPTRSIEVLVWYTNQANISSPEVTPLQTMYPYLQLRSHNPIESLSYEDRNDCLKNRGITITKAIIQDEIHITFMNQHGQYVSNSNDMRGCDAILRIGVR